MTKFGTPDKILTNDVHLIQSFADLDGLKQRNARTAMSITF